MKRSLLVLGIAAAVATPSITAAQPSARSKAITQFQIAKARFARDLDWHDLQANLRQVVELDPSFAKPYFHLGLVAVKLEQFKLAQRWFKRARKLQPTGRLAVQAQLQLDLVQRLIKIDSTSAGRKKRRFDEAMAKANLMLRQGVLGTAYEMANRAARIDGRRWEPAALQALVRLQQNQYSQAATSFSRALSLAPSANKPDLRVALQRTRAEGRYRGLIDAGHRELQANRTDAAARKFEAAQRLIPDRAEAGYLAASALVMNKRFQRAIAILVKVRAKSSDPTWAVKAHNMLRKLATMYGVGPKPPPIDSRSSRTLVRSVTTHPIHDAARAGNLNAVKGFERTGISIAHKDSNGMLALHHAAAAGRSNMVRYLLSRQRSQVNAQDNQGRTPLHHALAAGNDYMASMLLSRGANTRTRDRRRRSALHYAAQGGAVRTSHKLIAAGLNFRGYDSSYMQPIHVAAAHGRIKILAMLIARGASARTPASSNPRSKSGRQPIQYAAQSGKLAAVSFLLNRGASANPTRSGHPPPLYEAARAGHMKVVRELLRRGANVNATNGYRKETALHQAAKAGRYNIVQILLAAGATVNAKTRYGKTALDLATQLRVMQLIRRYRGRPGREVR